MKFARPPGPTVFVTFLGRRRDPKGGGGRGGRQDTAVYVPPELVFKALATEPDPAPSSPASPAAKGAAAAGESSVGIVPLAVDCPGEGFFPPNPIQVCMRQSIHHMSCMTCMDIDGVFMHLNLPRSWAAATRTSSCWGGATRRAQCPLWRQGSSCSARATSSSTWPLWQGRGGGCGCVLEGELCMCFRVCCECH